MTKQDKSIGNKNAPQGGVSRCGFLKGASFTAAGAAILDSGLVGAKEAAAAAPGFVGPGCTPVMLNINGANRRVELEARTTLAEALRFELDLTGTKVVCASASGGLSPIVVPARLAQYGSIRHPSARA